MVCSTQPYGKEVRYSSAPNSEPAMDGETRDGERARTGLDVGRESEIEGAPRLRRRAIRRRDCESFDAGHIDGQVQFHGVGFFVGERFAGDAWRCAPAARARATPRLASPRLGICTSFVAPSRTSSPFDVERNARGLGVRQVVVDQRGDHHLVALHEESRHHQAQNQVLAHDGLERRRCPPWCRA